MCARAPAHDLLRTGHACMCSCTAFCPRLLILPALASLGAEAAHPAATAEQT